MWIKSEPPSRIETFCGFSVSKSIFVNFFVELDSDTFQGYELSTENL